MHDYRSSIVRPARPPTLSLASVETPRNEDEELLHALQMLISERMRVAEPTRDVFEELYSDNAMVDPLTATPLPHVESTRRAHGRRPLGALVAVMTIVIGSATAFALTGAPFAEGQGWRNTQPSQIATSDTLPLEVGRSLSPIVGHGTAFQTAHSAIEEEDRPEAGNRSGGVREPADSGGSAARGTAVRDPQRRPAAPQTARRRSQGPLVIATGPVTPAPEPEGSDGQLSSIVDSVLGEALTPRRETVLPPTPDRADVLGGLRSVSPAVGSCGSGQSGRITVDVTVNGRSGRIGSSRVHGVDEATAACVQRALRGAQFSRFDDDAFTINGFPYQLR